ncbi:MAG: type II secretion system protein GspN, partial [Myxococcales bacterium]|nr:type II secretion system protein GspN [Myxococcales bacterium]
MIRWADVRPKLPRIAGYAAFFVGCFVIAAYLTFPWDALRGRVISELERAVPGYSFDIESLSPSWLTGVELTNVRARKNTARASEERVEVLIDELTIRVSPLAYLLGRTQIRFGGELGDGTLDGAVSVGEEDADVELEFSDLHLKRLALVKPYIGLPIDGIVNGTVDLHLAQAPKDPKDENADTSSGSIDLNIGGITVGDGRSKLKFGPLQDGITVETIRAGNLVAKVNIEKGVATIDTFASKGPDLEFQLTGDANLALPMSRSRMNLLARIRFTDGYKNKSDRTKGMFTLLDVA